MDIEGFAGACWTARTEFVHLPPLAQFFRAEIDAAHHEFQAEHGREPDDAEGAEIGKRTVGFRFRGLSGHEFGVARQKAAARKKIPEMIDALFAETPDGVRKAVAAIYGTDAEMAEEDAENLYCVARAIVWPEIPAAERLRVASTLHRNFPGHFRRCALSVRMLTGLGAEPGKPAPSSGNPE